jgi:hypothetical protein
MDAGSATGTAAKAGLMSTTPVWQAEIRVNPNDQHLTLGALRRAAICTGSKWRQLTVAKTYRKISGRVTAKGKTMLKFGVNLIAAGELEGRSLQRFRHPPTAKRRWVINDAQLGCDACSPELARCCLLAV